MATSAMVSSRNWAAPNYGIHSLVAYTRMSLITPEDSYFDERHGRENSCPSEGEALKDVAGEGFGGVGG